MGARLLLATLVSIGLVVAGTVPALAHISVLPAEAPAGGFTAYTFRMPNEKNVANTSLRVEFPPDMVVSRFMPKPGWEREVLRDNNQRIVGVSWTGGSLAPDEFDEFSIVARNPRQPGTVAFKAYQGYADGTVVEWVGGATAEEPAPVVNIVEATGAVADAHGQVSGGSGTGSGPGGAGSSTGGSGATNPPTTGSERPNPTTSSGGSDLSLVLALGAAILAIIALALAAVSLARRPQAT
jgi:uncharacterized protein YcnI